MADVLDHLRAEHDAVFGSHNCPQDFQESFERYVQAGIPTGDCLRAVLANDLKGAFGRADVNTARRMAAIVSYVYNCVPHSAQGSYEAVDAWIARKREERARARRAEGAG